MAARKFLTPIDMTKLEVRNLVNHLLASAPGSPTEGLVYHDTTNHVLSFYNGSAWITLGRLDQVSAPTASVSLNSQKITNLLAPTTGTDATNRTYVLGLTPNELTALAADYSVNSHKITNLSTPTAGTDAATMAYVDAQVSGARDVKESVRVATAAALPAYTRTTNVLTANANGALAAVDGTTLVANDRLLQKDGAAGADNGIYTVTTVGDASNPYVLTRTSDANTSALVTAGMFVWAEEGTANADTGWLLTTNNPITLNTTALTFTQVSALGQITAGNGLSKSGSTLSIDTNITVDKTTAQTLTNKTLTSPVINTPTGIVKGDVGLGNVDNTSNATERAATATLTNKTLTTPTLTSPVINTGVSGTAIDTDATMAANSDTLLASQKAVKTALALKALASRSIATGTGLSGGGDLSADRTLTIDTAVVVRKYAADIGDNSATAIVVTHSLGTRDVTVQVYDASTFATVDVDVVRTSTSVVTLNFAVAPGTAAYRVVVHA